MRVASSSHQPVVSATTRCSRRVETLATAWGEQMSGTRRSDAGKSASDRTTTNAMSSGAGIFVRRVRRLTAALLAGGLVAARTGRSGRAGAGRHRTSTRDPCHGERRRAADLADQRRRLEPGARREHRLRHRQLHQGAPAGRRRRRRRRVDAQNIFAYDISTGNPVTSSTTRSTPRA